ncbi:apolipoprotein N-acyltransferase [Sphingomonas sp.]|uniref:apolipoprotein N-acyltransferase n=1 Tax=Sphingomonas sp. TaxID=28214 RepID=UPI0035B39013
MIQRLERLCGWRALAAAFGLGLLAALAYPPVHALPVLLLSLPGLLILAGAAQNWRRAAVIGLFWGWGNFAGGLYWLTNAILTDVARFWWLVPIAVPALSLPLGLFVAVPTAVARMVPAGWSRVLVFSGCWVLSELLRGVVFTGFPWNLMGSAWAFNALPLQGAAWFGVQGLSLLTVLAACSPLLGWRAMGASASALAAFGLFGWLRLSEPAPAPRDVTLLLIQANIAQDLKWRPEARAMILERYLEITREATQRAAAQLPPGHRMVVLWPEAAVPFLIADDEDIRHLVADALPEGAILLAGTVRAEFGEGRRAQRIFNSLVAIDAAATVRAVYDKVHLVPFGEYMPLQGLIPIRLVTGGMDFSAGPGVRTLDVPGLPPFGPLVCYEVIFPAAVVGATRPEWLVNVTNDAWYGVSAGPYQHLATARLRAVEEGLPLARVAQTGVSAVFDAYGRETGRIPLGTTGVLQVQLPGAIAPTLFSRFGLWIPGVLAVAMTMLGWISGQRRKPKANMARDPSVAQD